LREEERYEAVQGAVEDGLVVESPVCAVVVEGDVGGAVDGEETIRQSMVVNEVFVNLTNNLMCITFSKLTEKVL
jgi:hypothetical protein